jgi:hypothetical protein
VTVLASVIAVGAKIPLVFITVGRTGRVEQSQIRNLVGHGRTRSISGWETSDTFQDYLTKLRSEMGEKPIHLLLDCSSTHRTEAVKEAAVTLEITFDFLPPGLTDEVQRLDGTVFIVLKVQAKRFFHGRFRLNPPERRTKQHVVADMVTACSLLGQSAIEAEWDIHRL